MELTSILASGVALGIIIGVTEVIKRTKIVNDRFIALVSLAVGAAFAVTTMGVSVQSVWAGIIAGLAACGLWSGAKNTFK